MIFIITRFYNDILYYYNLYKLLFVYLLIMNFINHFYILHLHLSINNIPIVY